MSISPPFSIKFKSKYFPLSLWKNLSNKGRSAMESSLFIFSFDCDTEEDINVAWKVHTRLADMGIAPVYAVPGELLKKGEKTYRKIYEAGAEFINHGGRNHTYFDTQNNRHASCFFYDQQSWNVLKEDIFQGHQILQDVLGVNAKGWRTPHFGTFQEPQHLEFLYSVLKELNYTFSTSTVPQKAYQHASLYQENGIVEIPVTGIYSEPLNIMDTWAYFAAPDRHKTPEDYLDTCKFLASFSAQKPLLINIYGDPSHIHDQEDFFTGVGHLVKTARNTNYTQLLGGLNGNLRTI